MQVPHKIVETFKICNRETSVYSIIIEGDIIKKGSNSLLIRTSSYSYFVLFYKKVIRHYSVYSIFLLVGSCVLVNPIFAVSFKYINVPMPRFDAPENAKNAWDLL